MRDAGRRTLSSEPRAERIARVRRASRNCKIANFHVQEVRVVIVVGFLYVSRNGCASRFFAVVVSKRHLPLTVGFSGVIFRVRLSHSLVIFVKSCYIPFVLFISELCIMVSVRSLSLSDLLLSSNIDVRGRDVFVITPFLISASKHRAIVCTIREKYSCAA